MENQEEVVSILGQPQVIDMLNHIRMRKGMDLSVENLKDYMKVSRNIADKLFGILMGKDGSSDNRISFISRQERKIFINGTLAYFLGISIGSKFIRVVLLDLNFEPQDLSKYISEDTEDLKNEFDEDESCKKSFTYRIAGSDSDNFSHIRNVVSRIVSLFLDYKKCDSKFPLLGIGFGVTGPVDFDAQIWRSSPRITITNMDLADLIGYENRRRIDEMRLFVSLDNNAKTAAISEYQYLQEEAKGMYSEDLAVIYIGSGVGLGSIVDKTLFRGEGNRAGELGHVQLLNDSKSSSNQHNTQTIENLLLEKSNSIGDSLREYLPNVLNLLSCILGVGKFILVGHSVQLTDTLINEIMDQRFRFTVQSTQAYCSAETSRGVPYTAAIGAAIESYYNLCNYSEQDPLQERTNLAKIISWK